MERPYECVLCTVCVQFLRISQYPPCLSKQVLFSDSVQAWRLSRGGGGGEYSRALAVWVKVSRRGFQTLTLLANLVPRLTVSLRSRRNRALGREKFWQSSWEAVQRMGRRSDENGGLANQNSHSRKNNSANFAGHETCLRNKIVHFVNLFKTRGPNSFPSHTKLGIFLN